MSKVRFKGHVLLTLRTVLTVIAWAALIIYVHPLGHKYIGDIREILESPVSQLGAQVVLLSFLVYFIMLSLPFLPNLRVRGLSILVLWAVLLVLGHQLDLSVHAGSLLVRIFHSLRVKYGRRLGFLSALV